MATIRQIPRSGPLVKNHVGDEFDPAFCDFFAPPPPVIGTVLTQWSTLTPSARFMDPALRLVIFLVTVGTIAAVGAFFGGAAQNLVLGATLGTAAGFLVGAVFWIATRGLRSCTYVGELGAAQIWCSGSRDRIFMTEVFVFESAFELRIQQIHTYAQVKGVNVYTGTNYSYRWLNPAGAVFTVSGRYYSEAGTPPPDDQVYFARRAELVWSAYLLEHLDIITNDAGNLEFALGDADRIELGDDSLAIHTSTRGETALYPRDDITRFTITAGQLTIGRSTGESTTLRLEDISNAHVFLLAAQSRLR